MIVAERVGEARRRTLLYMTGFCSARAARHSTPGSSFPCEHSQKSQGASASYRPHCRGLQPLQQTHDGLEERTAGRRRESAVQVLTVCESDLLVRHAALQHLPASFRHDHVGSGGVPLARRGETWIDVRLPWRTEDRPPVP